MAAFANRRSAASDDRVEPTPTLCLLGGHIPPATSRPPRRRATLTDLEGRLDQPDPRAPDRAGAL